MNIEHGKPCPKCNKKLTKFAWHGRCHYCGANFEESPSDPKLPPPPPLTLKPGQKEYRVITQADQWFMGKFSPERMTVLMNTLSAEGWRVIAVATADRATWFGSFGGSTRQEMVVFLERVVETETVVELKEEVLADKL